ncbi:ABC transporter ATP-binding protein [Liquorilactobacillus mali]|uniref:ABC-type sugar transport system, ATPase component n=1 Tax=Liquorilactobacillus mali TaxID=1618 RepID=A0A0R2FQY5_9LACO|nr:ABC transporter ATP-binding protein [Liquorilactobacillus mali]KRN26900.1 ABC-type sugar transport system, ATPase component [Liquorilactobacillus mali]MDN7146401.1 ABC transporter ATP-binding protein [Liquorilactobacillus mali]MDV7758190.1 ATP-binding cassette domain-containing protein [Liquorilactobacillus mali]
MNKIQIEHLYKRYDNAENDTLKDINLEIDDKEFVAIIGPSGCGKSTLLRCFSGLEEVTKGKINVDGKRFDNIPPQKRSIAMVFQDYALYPHMTVYNNMAFNLKLSKFSKSEIDSRVKEAAQKLNLTDYLARKPAQLSGGQRQRVALGRAMVRAPEVFLMDEPLSNLDAKLRVSTRQDIIKLHRQLKTITIYVTHDQAEAMAMADKILIMRKGVIQQYGKPEELYDNPRNLFVARFIGSPSMNILKGTLSNEGIFTIGEKDYNLRKIINKKFLQEAQRETILGFRPEKVSEIRSENSINRNSDKLHENFVEIVATKNLVEYMGGYTLVYLKTVDGVKIVIQTSQKVTEDNQQLHLYINKSDIYLFDAKSGHVLR